VAYGRRGEREEKLKDRSPSDESGERASWISEPGASELTLEQSQPGC